MQIISSSQLRLHISEILNAVKYQNRIVGIGRRNAIEALIMKYPERLNKRLNGITNMNANSESFRFLEEEPDLYGVRDLRKRYKRYDA